MIEENGISTISITLSKEITRKVRPPRAVYTGLPLGHPISFPGQVSEQALVLRFLLQQIKEMKIPGSIADITLG